MVNKKKSTEAERQLKRKQQKAESMRRARLKMKENPALHEEIKKKDRQRYQEKKAKGQIKLVSDMSSREHRAAKKKWQEKQSKYRKKIKAHEENIRILENDTPPASPATEQHIAQEQNSNSGGSLRGKKIVRRNRYKLKKKIQELEEKNEKLTTKLEKYKKRLSRLSDKKTRDIKETPRKIVRRQMRSGERKTMYKKLLFSEVISQQIKENFRKEKSKKKKNVMIGVLSGKIVKKYRLYKSLKGLTSKKIIDKSEGSAETDPEKRLSLNKIRTDVIRFLETDKASRLCSGKKETVTKKKLKKQKRYLNETLIDLHKMFVDEYPQHKLSYQTFCRFRPFWILPPKASDRETCLCKVHENMGLLVRKAHSLEIVNEKTSSDILKTLCCDYKNEACLDRKCEVCNINTIQIKDFEDEPAIYQKWVRQQVPVMIKGVMKLCPKTVKVNIETTKKQIAESLINEIPQFLAHVGNIVHQYDQLKKIKENLAKDDVLAHIDFSENYMCKLHREIQSAHFGGSKPQVTIHTCVVYFNHQIKETPLSVGTISECNRHDPPAIVAHLFSLKNEIAKYVPSISKLHFLSDGPSTQYKNKTMFQLMSSHLTPQFGLQELHWHYSESSHGKGAPDGVGAVLKRTADNLVAHMVDIPDCDTLVSRLQEHCKSVIVTTVDEKSIKEVDEQVPQKMLPFKGTMKIHEVVFKKGFTSLQVRSRTCGLCAGGLCSHYLLGHIDLINSSSSTKSTRKLSVREVYTSSDEEENSVLELDSLQLGDYILVKFTTKKKDIHYVGVIDSFDPESDVYVKYLKKISDEKFMIDSEKVWSVDKNDIVAKIKQPIVNNRQQYIFKDIAKFNNLTIY